MNSQSDSAIRVRFAPSPTGPLHIGGVRTALFNYLFAKKHKGTFILRIEDTDQQRYVPGAEKYILETLHWLDITPDESIEKEGKYGPYKQSERKEIYEKYAQQLIKSGHAYYAFDTPEELENIRRKFEKNGETFAYNAETRQYLRNSLSLSTKETKELLKNNTPKVIRLKMPENENITFTDMVRGSVSFNTKNLDDKIIFKADGMPTYHLANVVDDHLMQISHVIRGEEWLPSTPLHVLLYKYLGWHESMPRFAHLPLILKPEGKGKLSKRDADKHGFPVFPLQWKDPKTQEISHGFREEGYLPPALLNFLALLGWNPGTEQEVFTKQELIQTFSIEKVQKSGARFDIEKAKWFNAQHIKKMPDEEILNHLIQKHPEIDTEKLQKAIPLMKERITFLDEIITQAQYLFHPPTSYDEKTLRKKWKEKSPKIVEKFLATIENITDFSAQNIETAFKKMVDENQYGFGAAMISLRLAITGKGAGPSLFDIMEIIGKTETIRRLEKALTTLPTSQNT